MNRQSRLVRYIFMNQMELQKLYFLSKIKKKNSGKSTFSAISIGRRIVTRCVRARTQITY